MNVSIIPAAWSPYVGALLRIMTGLLFLEHGTAKLLSFPVVPGLAQMESHGMLLFTGGMEFVGGALFAVGLLTRPVAFILSGYMAAAYFIAHFPAGFYPILNHGEPAILYCFVFLYFAAAGSCAWSIDNA